MAMLRFVRQRLAAGTPWWRDLGPGGVRRDVLAGITAGVLILPQAIALATLAGLSPEHGLYTAIFPVVVVALLGSSRQSLAGPNTALAVLTAMTIAPFASIGSPEYIQYAITLTFMAGVWQLLLGCLRLGNMFNYFSHTVMVALVTGVGLIIVVQQLGGFMGVVMNTHDTPLDTLHQLTLAVSRANPFAVAAGAVTLLAGWGIRRWRPHWPHYILAVLIGMAFTQLIHGVVGASGAGIDMLGNMHFSALPLSAPDFSPEGFAEFSSVAYPASLSMAVLGLMQSTVIARSLAAKSGQERLSVNQEVLAQGVSNVVGSFLSCFISCASFNRSAANLEAGATTPLAGLVSAAALALLVLLAAPLVAWLPLPVMSGVLILVGLAMVKVSDIRRLMASSRHHRVVFGLVLLTTVFASITDGLYLGILLSVVGYLRRMAKPELTFMLEDEKKSLLRPGMDAGNATAISVSGSLFFGSVQHLERAVEDVARRDRRRHDWVVACHAVSHMDVSGASILAREALKRRSMGCRVAIWLQKRHVRDAEVAAVLHQGFGEQGLVLG